MADAEAVSLLSYPVREGSPLSWLAQTFDLSSFDLDVILITLAPELDRRYERLYAYLQDNVSFRRPSVDLALNLDEQLDQVTDAMRQDPAVHLTGMSGDLGQRLGRRAA